MTILAMMGSGETAPAMRRVHRDIFAATGPGRAVLLDTPYGFQENADELTQKIGAYFADTVGRPVEAARWRSRTTVRQPWPPRWRSWQRPVGCSPGRAVPRTHCASGGTPRFRRR